MCVDDGRKEGGKGWMMEGRKEGMNLNESRMGGRKVERGGRDGMGTGWGRRFKFRKVSGNYEINYISIATSLSRPILLLSPLSPLSLPFI